jgi:hypothetical protein
MTQQEHQSEIASSIQQQIINSLIVELAKARAELDTLKESPAASSSTAPEATAAS